MSDEKKECAGRRYAPVHGASCARLEPWATGDWVRYSDFQALQRELHTFIELGAEAMKQAKDDAHNAAIEEAAQIMDREHLMKCKGKGYDPDKYVSVAGENAAEIRKLKRPVRDGNDDPNDRR